MSMSIFIKKGIPNDIRYVYEEDWDKHNTCLLPIHEESVHIVSVEAFQNWIKEWPTYSDPKYKLSWLWNTKFRECNYNRGVDEDEENQENQDKPVNNLCFARLFWIAKHKCLCPYCGVHVDLHDLLFRHYVKLGLTPKFIVKEVQVGKDQEKAQSEKDSHSKNRGGKKTKPTTRYLYHETIVSRMGSYFPNRWPLSYLNLTKNMKTYIRRQQHKKILNTKT